MSATTASANASTSAKSVLNESRQIERAAMLIEMGARMQVLESETSLSYERLIRLYKEIAGKSPSVAAVRIFIRVLQYRGYVKQRRSR